jgi:hypothetical protein
MPRVVGHGDVELRQSPALSQRSISWVSGSHPIGLLSSTASSSSKNQPTR